MQRLAELNDIFDCKGVKVHNMCYIFSVLKVIKENAPLYPDTSNAPSSRHRLASLTYGVLQPLHLCTEGALGVSGYRGVKVHRAKTDCGSITFH